MLRSFILWLAGAGVLCAAGTPVILISIDTLRADHLGIYGYRRIATPNIDSFAQGGTVFENIACQTPLTLPSHTSLFTSTYPFESGIQENAEVVPQGAVTPAGVLRQRGYKTAAFIGSVFLEREMGLDQGFETYDSPFHFEAFSPLSGDLFFGGLENPYSVRDRRDGALVVAAALHWISAHREEPIFVFVHLFDVHAPYSVPESARRNGISPYDAKVQYADELIGRLKTGLAREGLWDKSLAILLSDHGEGLGDHGESTHGYFIYQCTVHVPLMIHWPAGSSGLPARIDRPGGLIDLAPTILDFLHIPAPSSFEGTSLFDTRPRAVYSESRYAHDSFGWSPLRAVRMDAYKYIDAPKPELYDLRKDPAERSNIVLANPAETRALRAELAKLLASHARRASAQATASPQTEKLLNSLGYVAQGPRAHTASGGPDPKDRLPEYLLYQKSMEAVKQRRLPAAVAILRQILASDSTNTLARRDLASCYLDLHDDAKARADFEKVVAAAPDDYVSQFGLGLAEKHLGLLNQARAHLETACRLAPQAAQCRHELDEVRQKPD